jgi:hypothetical protein
MKDPRIPIGKTQFLHFSLLNAKVEKYKKL